jgi:hypothetical protein
VQANTRSIGRQQIFPSGLNVTFMLTAAITCLCFSASFVLVIVGVEKLLTFTTKHKR